MSEFYTGQKVIVCYDSSHGHPDVVQSVDYQGVKVNNEYYDVEGVKRSDGISSYKHLLCASNPHAKRMMHTITVDRLKKEIMESIRDIANEDLLRSILSLTKGSA